MKKFHFTLQKLKEFKESELDRQKNVLNKMRSELNTLSAELEELFKRLDDKNNELRRVYKNGAAALEISVHKRYISSLQQDIRKQKYIISLKEKEIEQQLGVVVEATKEVSTLENLEEKQLEEYKKLELKENELFVEEFVSNASSRN